MRKKFLFFLFFLASCSPGSIKEYQIEGEDIAKNIIKILERIESVSDLERDSLKLKKEFISLVKVMIEAKKYQNNHPEEEIRASVSLEVSENLKKEFMRIYQLEGCQDVMEALQRESLHKLDLFHRKWEGTKTEIYH
jgi:hypothetical protein